MKKAFALCASITAVAFAASAFGQSSDAPTREEALAAWGKAYETFSHPRCANCHTEDDRPRWSGPSYGLEEGEWRYHGMNIHADESRIGIMTVPCTTCHMAENSDAPHGPPGNDVWLLAPPEMVWWQQSSQDICEQIKDPDRNGGRTLAEVADHIDHDSLVLWGWDPGPGREPAPYSASEIAAAVTLWASAGAPCPADASTQ